MSANKTGGRQSIALKPSLLFQMGRTIPVPFQIAVTAEDKQEQTALNCTDILRLLPQRRIVCKTDYQNGPAVVKIFFQPDKAQRDYLDELQGYERLIKSMLLTPEVLSYGRLEEGDSSHKGWYVLYAYIDAAFSLQDGIALKPDIQSGLYIKQLLELIAKMHNAHVQQIDLHLNNFLIDRQHDKIYTIDCGDVSDLSNAYAQLSTQIHKNLADILSQLPIIYDQFTKEFVELYQQHLELDITISKKQIHRSMQQWRHWRIRKFLKKASRNCTEFCYVKTWTLMKAFHRDYSSSPWVSLYARLNEQVEHSRRLKDGNTATVALTECAERKVVIKRYNIKSFRHRLSRFWRPSRAWKTWQNAHQLSVLGIKTPKPIAVVEQRFGWFRSRAFYVSEYEPAEDALSELAQLEKLSDTCIEDFEQLFCAMIFSRMSHGDLKANNILMTDQGLTLIDLDAMTFHKQAGSFKRAFNRDVKRFMKNWSVDSKVYSQFEELISRLPL